MAKQQKKHRRRNARVPQQKELAALEQRIGMKIDSAAALFKEEIDRRWDRIEERFACVDHRFDKFKGYFEGLVNMVIAQNTRIDKVLLRLEDRNRHINLFETRN